MVSTNSKYLPHNKASSSTTNPNLSNLSLPTNKIEKPKFIKLTFTHKQNLKPKIYLTNNNPQIKLKSPNYGTVNMLLYNRKDNL